MKKKLKKKKELGYRSQQRSKGRKEKEEKKRIKSEQEKDILLVDDEAHIKRRNKESFQVLP